MRQTISHGASIDTATPQEVAAIIAGVLDRKQVTEYRRIKGIVNLNAAGAGNSADTSTSGADLIVPGQYDLLLERVAFGGNGLVAATTIGVYENDATSDTNLLEWIVVGASLKYSDSFSNRIYVTANSSVLIVVASGTANLQVTYNLQGRLIPAGRS